jgi:hypothetical protein
MVSLVRTVTCAPAGTRSPWAHRLESVAKVANIKREQYDVVIISHPMAYGARVLPVAMVSAFCDRGDNPPWLRSKLVESRRNLPESRSSSSWVENKN